MLSMRSQRLPRGVLPTHPLPIASDYAKKLARKSEMAQKGILLPTLKMILKTYYPLPVNQSPVLPQLPEIPSCSKSMPYIELESLGDDQTKSAHLEHR